MTIIDRSSQQAIAHNPDLRVHIEYPINMDGIEKKVELPFIIGVVSDLVGMPREPLPEVADRRFLEFDAGNINSRMQSLQPRVAFAVANTLTGDGDLNIDLTFACINDFSPGAVAANIAPLKQLLDARTQLAALLAWMDGNNRAQQLIEILLNDPMLRNTTETHSGFTALLQSALQPETAQARSTLQQAISTLAQHALHSVHRISGTACTAADNACTAIESIIAGIDGTLTAQINPILHHPVFQTLEGAWRGLHYLVTHTETDAMLKIRVLAISRRELHRTLKRFKGVNWEQSPIFKLIHDDVYCQSGGEPMGCLVGDYYFDYSPLDVELLTELAKIGSLAHCPVISAVSPAVLQMRSWQELVNPRDLSDIFAPADYAAWRSLRDSDDARYIGLTMPRFLARMPYGARTSPVDAFDFEEDTAGAQSDRYTWANSAYAMAVNISRSFKKYGWCAIISGIDGGIVNNLPMHNFSADTEGNDVPRATEVVISERHEPALARLGLIPLIACRNAAPVFFSAQSLLRAQQYECVDTTEHVYQLSGLHRLFINCRFAHYMKCIARDNSDSFGTPHDMENYLYEWIRQYRNNDQDAFPRANARTPLFSGSVDFRGGRHPYYWFRLSVNPQYLVGSLMKGFRIRVRLRASGWIYADDDAVSVQ